MADKKTPGLSDQIHAGHRSRVRQKFLTGGLEPFQDHEVLELLLFYARPRQDVNPMAHMLIQRFGNLAGVLDAPEEELCSVPGVGPHIAHFLNLIPQVMVQMARQMSHLEEPVSLRAARDLQTLLLPRYPLEKTGQMLYILTDAQHHVLAVHRYGSFASLALRKLATQAANVRASFTVLVERVDDSDGLLPPGRLEALDQLAEKLSTLRLPLWDYFAVDGLGRCPRPFIHAGRLLPR